MTESKVSDEVEAAAKALYEDDDLWSASERPWPARDAEIYRRLAASALSAAAKVRAIREGDGEVVAEIEGLIDAYWGLAFTEGSEGRTTDTPDGAAQDTRAAISRRLAALAASPIPATAGEQRTICEACGNSNLEASSAVWTDDGTAFCPKCAPPTDNLEAGAGDLVERLRTFLRQDDPEIDVDAFKMLSEAAAQLAAVTAENARLRDTVAIRSDEADGSLALFLEERTRATTAETQLEAALKALRHVEEWWLTDGMNHFNGAPYAIFAARAALSQEAPK